MIEAARLATPGDLPRVTELARAATAELRAGKGGEVWARREARQEPVEASLAPALADPDAVMLAGTIDEAVVGYAVAHVDAVPDGGRLAVIDDLYVEPGARGVGVGEAMIDAMLAWATDRGCFGIDAIALPGARETKNFFESFGLVARAIVVHRAL